MSIMLTNGYMISQDEGPVIIVQQSLIPGLDVTSLTASTEPPPEDTFPDADSDDGSALSVHISLLHFSMDVELS